MNQIKGFAPVVICLLILAAGYFFAYPQWTALSDNRAALAVQQQTNDSLKKSQADLSTFLSQYRSMSDKVEIANKILPPKKSEIQDVLSNLSRYAADSGISLAGVSFSDSAESAANTSVKPADYQINYIEMNISASGSYASFRVFLQELENSLRVMDIHSVELDSNETQNLEFKFVARVYYQN
jgi:Tfp pilus assembly protein PilO